jgi:phosphoribosylanthranilate isomerase
MNRVRVKICGVRGLEEAEAAIEYGADVLGFNFWPKSARYIEPETARSIIEKLSPLVSCIGVFVNEEPERIIEIASQTGLNAVQLHGDETPQYCEQLRSLKLIKAFRVSEDFDLSQIKNYQASSVLLDAKVKNNYGGTGEQFDWRIAVEAKRFAPIILAGGLNAENVSEAISFVRPMAVDVCSGVEAEPGRKDISRIREFMSVVKRTNSVLEFNIADH